MGIGEDQLRKKSDDIAILSQRTMWLSCLQRTVATINRKDPPSVAPS